MTASLFVIPSRFQVVNGIDGLDAGVRLLPFALVSGYGAIVGSTLAGRFKLPPIFIAAGGSGLQVLGFALLGTLPATQEIVVRTYGFQVLAGFGCGITYQCFYISMPVVAERQDAGKHLTATIIPQIKANIIRSGGDGSSDPVPHDGRSSRPCHCYIRVQWPCPSCAGEARDQECRGAGVAFCIRIEHF